LHNQILRYVYKKVFRFFEPLSARLASKFEKSTNMTQIKFCLKKPKKVSKNAEFHVDFKSVEKMLQKFTQKKLLAKM
jgi:hypothetical protein